jgi:hypothetical protein
VETLFELLSRLHDVESIIRWGGLVMICAIVFAETGLMIGFFCPFCRQLSRFCGRGVASANLEFNALFDCFSPGNSYFHPIDSQRSAIMQCS